MESKAMYLSTYEERENGSVYEEAYDGHNLSKLNLCDEGERGPRCSELVTYIFHHVQLLRLTVFCYLSLDLYL